ncbi:MAG: protoheme IX farnesyltransferase [Alphaproteobacteria bacterium]|jgi:protoheme IX farnesyltransferase
MSTDATPSMPHYIRLNIAEPKDYFLLLKPRVMSLVVFTAIVGLAVTPNNVHPFLQIISLLSIAIGAGASGALNMWFDADIDRVMDRTQARPIPAGKIQAETARDFGLWLSLLSVIMLALASNYLAAGLLAFTIFFYSVVYTMWLKRYTPQNIVIGGLSGALPPVIAAASVTGTITLESVILCAIIFFWTPPHFWALSLVKKDDYAAVKIPMMPNVKGDKRTIAEILIYGIVLFAVTLLPIIVGFGDIIYGLWAVFYGIYYYISCIKIYFAYNKQGYHKIAMRSFFVSIVYLFGLFLSLLIENLLEINLI